jgi:TRAP-type C4-dicarboxylate transport system substrate-binding protein
MTPNRILALMAVSGALLAGCDSSTNKATGAREVEPVMLTLANWQTGDADVGEWVQAVERLSEGEMRIEVRGGWRRGQVETDRGTLRDVRSGRVDLGHIAARAWDTLGVDSFRALDAPLLIDSLPLEEQVLAGPLGAAMLAGVEGAGVEPVALLPGALRRPVGVSRDLLGPDDYRGALIGLRPSGTHAETLRVLGARVTGVPSVVPLTGLDGTESDLATMDFDRYDRQARSATADVVLWPRPSTIVMNREAWDALTEEQREVITDAGHAAVGPAMTREREAERGAARSLCDRGLELVRAGASEVAALRLSVEPVIRELERDRDTREALERIRELKAEAPAEPVPACGDGGGGQPAPVPAELQGTWEVAVTHGEIAAAPRLPGEAVEDNWGDFTLVLGADGDFELLNDRYPGPVGLGTWSARGDLLTFTPGGTVEQGAGETWRYRWTLFRGTLALRRLGTGPTALTVAPLRRR